MKLSTILETLAAARLPSVTSEQLQHLVGTAEGKAFANDLKWFAAGEAGRREQLAAVVNALAPGVRRTVEQLGFQFDLPAIIAAAKFDGCTGINTIKGANANPGNQARAVAYLKGAGLQVAIAPRRWRRHWPRRSSRPTTALKYLVAPLRCA